MNKGTGFVNIVAFVSMLVVKYEFNIEVHTGIQSDVYLSCGL